MKLEVLKVNEEVLRNALKKESDFVTKQHLRKALEYLLEDIKKELKEFKGGLN